MRCSDAIRNPVLLMFTVRPAPEKHGVVRCAVNLTSS
jgi:hypothetical protein